LAGNMSWEETKAVVCRTTLKRNVSWLTINRGELNSCAFRAYSQLCDILYRSK
jgi:hypothetical protein